jgi:hydroxyacylglutathione hydrolase
VDHVGEFPPDRPVVLHCQGGSRSAIGASLLQAHGIENVSNLAGGFADWSRKGKPVIREADETASTLHE